MALASIWASRYGALCRGDEEMLDALRYALDEIMQSDAVSLATQMEYAGVKAIITSDLSCLRDDDYAPPASRTPISA